ncbi:MAG: hypothetical protein LBT09_01960 [Planctomycetaceae bacterium]|nr:hypothetical protein [Planctomycetaceae bacterium]
MKLSNSHWAVEAHLQIRLSAMRFYVPDVSLGGAMGFTVTTTISTQDKRRC